MKAATLMMLVLGTLVTAIKGMAAEATTDTAKLIEQGKVVVNYHRFDGDYTQVTLWTWDARLERTPEVQDIEPHATTDFGVQFAFDPSLYGNDDQHDRIGFIPRLRRSWDYKDGSDRFWTPALGQEIWLVGNDPKIYTERPDISPKLTGAFIDGPKALTLVLSHPYRKSLSSKDIVIRGKNKTAIKNAAFANHQNTIINIELAAPIDPGAEFTAQLTGYRELPVVPRRILDNPGLFSTNQEMGAIYSPEQTTFRLFSPVATEATLILYDNPTGNEGREEVAMNPTGSGIWEVTVAGDLEGRHYMFRTNTRRHGLSDEAADPYAVCMTGSDAHARITDLRKTDPPGFRPIKRPPFSGLLTDAVIYEMHVRDFTMDPSSGAKHPGKYLGFIEKGLRLDDDPSTATGFDHLKELGVTHVQLMPPQDCHNDESKFDYNWGYMTLFFNSPEGIYASDIRTEARIRELKKLIQELHNAGIGVIFDVVYNHTAPGNSFEELAPGYYHRMRDDGSFWNGSGTGNEFRSEAPMARKFIIDSCRYWVEEYGVDGFRFDLMGLVDLETMKQLRKEIRRVYPQALVYGEPWAGGTSALPRLTDKSAIRGTGIGAFNDNFRDAIKGSTRGPEPGYVQNGSRRDEVKRGIAGSMDEWTINPSDTLNYISAHDDMTLWDKLQVSTPGATDEQRVAMHQLAFAILTVSQGGLFMHGGCEMLRTKDGMENSYSAGDPVNSIDWTWKRDHYETVQYFRQMIELRKDHPVFRIPTAQEVKRRLAFRDDVRPHTTAIAFTLNGEGMEGESWQQAWVLINPTAQKLVFRLPIEQEMRVYALGSKVYPHGSGKIKSQLTVPAHSLAILAR